jgi:CubicO group peptidase (beta-lactamase class C family)
MRPRRRFLSTGLSALALAAGRQAFAGENDWPVAAPASQGIDAAALQGVFDGALDRTDFALNGIVVVRNGCLVGERYYGWAPPSLFVINSVTKSVVSMLVGVALSQGKLKNLDQTVGELLPEVAAKTPDSLVIRMTLAEILTQTSGLQEIGGLALSLSPDRLGSVMAQPVHRADPPAWAYCNAAVSLLAPILVRATGVSIEEYARQVLFAPLGIERFGWDHDSTGNAMSWVGVKLSPRDLVKIAWTMGDGGRWQGRQVVPERWAMESVQSRVTPSWRVPPMAVDGYGYLWFTGTLKGRRAFWGWGLGSQFTLMVPSLRLAVATAAAVPRADKATKQNAKVMSVIADVVALAS